MEVIFDNTALEILRMMGYRYFCNREILVPVPDPNDGMCAYWEMIPFKTKARLCIWARAAPAVYQ